MPHTDENGRHLTAVLDYLLDGDVHAYDISAALGISTSTYYRRIKQTGYPDAEELRRVAKAFDLNFLDLLVRFGLMSEEQMAQEAGHYCDRRRIPRELATSTVSGRAPRRRRERPATSA